MRSVIRNPGVRCVRCGMPPRWCLCPAERHLALPFRLGLVTHRRELGRPSSTGNLLARIVPAARQLVWEPERQLPVATLALPGHETWLLHPQGEAPPEGADPAALQVILLDGSWSEARGMARVLGGAGRLVRLPLSGESRFWLRAQQEEGRWSTAEALMFLLRHFGLYGQEEILRLQFELLVYASLRARGQIDRAAAFLAGSPLPAAMPEFIAALQVRRSRPERTG